MEEARQYSAVNKVGYRDALVLGALVIFAAFILWILLGPETSSLFPLKRHGELTTKGWVALLCGLYVFARSIPHAFHILLKRPALEVVDGQLNVWMLPYQSIPLANIFKIEVGDNSIDIYSHGKPRRRLNARVLDQPRVFFVDIVRPQLANGDMVQERRTLG